MAVDLRIITGHNLTYEEIIKLQAKIESDDELRCLYWWNKKDNIENWNKIASADRLNTAWVNNENQKEIDGVFLFDTLYFPTFFGELQFHKHIIQLPAFSLKLWTMESDNELRGNIIQFYNRLANILGQQNILYFGDSYAKSSWIGELIYAKSLEEIIRNLKDRETEEIQEVGKSIIEKHYYIQKL